MSTLSEIAAAIISGDGGEWNFGLEWYANAIGVELGEGTTHDRWGDTWTSSDGTEYTLLTVSKRPFSSWRNTMDTDFTMMSVEDWETWFNSYGVQWLSDTGYGSEFDSDLPFTVGTYWKQWVGQNSKNHTNSPQWWHNVEGTKVAGTAGSKKTVTGDEFVNPFAEALQIEDDGPMSGFSTRGRRNKSKAETGGGALQTIAEGGTLESASGEAEGALERATSWVRDNPLKAGAAAATAAIAAWWLS